MVATPTNMRHAFVVAFSLLAWMAPAQKVNSQEKKVTVLLNNISLEKALTIIEISYGVQFSYSDDIVPTQAIIKLNIQNETLSASLDKLLKPFKIIFKFTNNNRIVLIKITREVTQTIRGVVTDFVTHLSIPGISIIIQNSSPVLGATTDELGKFKIEHVPVGRTTIVVSSVGYDIKTLSNLLVIGGKELVLEIALSESITRMNEIVVTALKNDGIPGDGAAITSGKTFSVEESKRFAGSMGDPARMASAFAGVTGGSDENNSLVIRGNSPRGVLWMLEGIEMPNPNHFASEGASSGVVSVLSSNMISSSDFLTGAFPAQYGNALSGVFDISLRSGNNEKREYSFQSGLLGIEASSEGPFSKRNSSSYLVNYRYSTLSILDMLGFKLNDAGQYKDYQDLSFKLNFPTARIGTFSLFGIGGSSKSSKSDTTVLDNSKSEMGIMGLTYKNIMKGNTFLQASISYSGTQISKLNEIKGVSAGTFATEENYSKSYIRTLLTIKRRITNRYFIEAGTIFSQLRYNFFLKTINPENRTYMTVINFSEHERDLTYITQGFLTARQYFTPSLFGFYGFHFMSFSLTNDFSLEPRAGLRWQASPNKSLSIAYGKHSRIENLQYYLARNHQVGGNEVQVNKHLGFTRADHLVLSYDEALSSRHRLKIETYYQQLYNAPVQTDPTSNYAALNEDTGFITDILNNNGRGRNYGIELSLEKSFSNNMYYLINGSVFQSHFAVDQQAPHSTPYNGNYSIHILGGKEFEVRRRNRFGLNIKITQAGGRRYIPIDLEKSIQEKRQVYKWEEAFDNHLPTYFRTDFQLVYKINRARYSFEWRLDIQNVTDHQNAAWYYYDGADQSVKLKNQIGAVPLLSFRIDF